MNYSWNYFALGAALGASGTTWTRAAGVVTGAVVAVAATGLGGVGIRSKGFSNSLQMRTEDSIKSTAVYRKLLINLISGGGWEWYKQANSKNTENPRDNQEAQRAVYADPAAEQCIIVPHKAIMIFPHYKGGGGLYKHTRQRAKRKYQLLDLRYRRRSLQLFSHKWLQSSILKF